MSVSTHRERVTVRAPASLSNLGPGFDTLGVAVQGLWDEVIIEPITGTGISVSVDGDQGIPTDPHDNTASVAAAEVFSRAGYTGGARIRIKKGIPFGSGLGGSAASAAAGAAAANALLGEPLSEQELVECALTGEEVASESLHGDNVIPALIGGVVLVDSEHPERYRRMLPGRDLHFAIIVPELQIKTSEARKDLPESVTLRTAVNHASALGLLVHALAEGDVAAIQESILRDRIVEPRRAARIPCFNSVRAAAASAGAKGCAVSGSGPTLFAVTSSEAAAKSVAEAMASACRKAGLECTAMVSQVDTRGAYEHDEVR